MQPDPDRTIYVKFVCKACGHTFPRKLRRIYVDAPTLDRYINKEPASHSEFIIPRPIECTRCKAVNQAELTGYDKTMIRMSAVLRGMFATSTPDDPVQVVKFTYDGKVMHPLDALAYYQKLVERKPDYLPHRLRYANTLRTIGHWDEAEDQYRFIVEKDATQLDAWYNLAIIAFARKQKRAARQALENLVANALSSKDPDREVLEQDAKDILAGVLPYETLSMDLFLVRDSSPKQEKAQGKKRLRRRGKR